MEDGDGMPGEPRRPLWYRLAGTLEPGRPVFAWLVEREAVVRVALLVLVAVLVSAPLVSAAVRRRRSSGS